LIYTQWPFGYQGLFLEFFQVDVDVVGGDETGSPSRSCGHFFQKHSPSEAAWHLVVRTSM
jgi:hypothetical protein